MVIRMERAGSEPALETFNTLIAGNIEAAERGKARDMKDFQWESCSWTILIEGLLDEGGMAEAYQLAIEMFAPGPSPFNAVICDM